MEDPRPPQPTLRIPVSDIRFLKLLSVAERRSRPMGITVEQYLLGILTGKFAPIPTDEIDREPEPE